MVTRHRRPARRNVDNSPGDSRGPNPNGSGLPRRSLGRRRARGRRGGLRPRPVQVLDFRRPQQMPAAPVVGRAQHRAARARRRSQKWRAATGGAAARPGASLSSWKSAASATGDRHPRKRPPGPATSRSCAALSIVISRTCHHAASPPPWIWRNPLGPSMRGDCCGKGQSAFAVLGVNASETQASIDAALTFGILWLEACRHSSGGKFLVEGLRLFVPQACSVARSRAHGQPEPQPPPNGVCLNWTNATMRWWKSTAPTAATSPHV